MHSIENIIIGGGVSGLLCGNYLQSKGYKTAIIEKNTFPGGLYSGFNLNGNIYDIAISSMMGYDSGFKGPLNMALSMMGIDINGLLSKYESIDYNIFPDFTIKFPNRIEDLSFSLIDLFPLEKNAIISFIDFIKEIGKIINSMAYMYTTKYQELVNKYSSISYFDFLRSNFSDNKLRAVLSARVFSSKVSAFVMLCYLSQLCNYGLSYFNEGNKTFIDLLISKYIDRGGQILYHSDVTDLHLKNKEIQYIVINGTDTYKAKQYFSSISPQFFSSRIHGEKSDIDSYFYKISLPAILMYFETNTIPESFKGAARVYLFKTYNINDLLTKKEGGELILNDGLKINLVKKNSYYIIRVEADCVSRPFTDEEKNYVKERLIEICWSLGFKDGSGYVIKTPSDFEDSGLLYRGGYSWMADYTIHISTDDLEKSIANNFTQIGAWTSYGSGLLPIAFSCMRAYSKTKSIK